MHGSAQVHAEETGELSVSLSQAPSCRSTELLIEPFVSELGIHVRLQGFCRGRPFEGFAAVRECVGEQTGCARMTVGSMRVPATALQNALECLPRKPRDTTLWFVNMTVTRRSRRTGYQKVNVDHHTSNEDISRGHGNAKARQSKPYDLKRDGAGKFHAVGRPAHAVGAMIVSGGLKV